MWLQLSDYRKAAWARIWAGAAICIIRDHYSIVAALDYLLYLCYNKCMDVLDNVIAFPNRKADVAAAHIGGEPIDFPPPSTYEEFKKRADEQLSSLSEAERRSIAEEEWLLYERRRHKLATIATRGNVINIFDRQ